MGISRANGIGVFLAVAVGCGSVENKNAGIDARTADPDDAAVGVDGTAALCTADTALRCEGATLVSCNDTGTAEVAAPCTLRCDATALRCENKVHPSNGFTTQLDAATGQPALVITQSLFFSTTTDFNATTGTITVGGQQVKAALVPGSNGAPDVVVLSVGSLNIPAGVKLTPVGDRPAAIMSAGDVTIAGSIEAIGGLAVTSEPCFGGSSGGTGADNDVPGGGGGGFGQAGAGGGTIVGIGAGKSGGSATGTATLIPLRGGCSGGTDALGSAGRGGGAVQITSATAIHVSGAIGANGAGGVVSSGGGSGGAILLEAPTVELTGGLFANGGGGGCGGFSAGANGSNSTTPALGANCGGNPGTASGGNGGAGTVAPTSGSSTTNRVGSVDRAGGGGGAIGRIRVNTLDMTIAGGGSQSPAASVGRVRGR